MKEYFLEITPMDTLFFRDGKPFSMGSESWADSLFPPPPSVFYGAIRSLYFSYGLVEFEKAGKDDDPTKSIEITSVYYRFKAGDFFIPTPLDIVKYEKKFLTKLDLSNDSHIHSLNNTYHYLGHNTIIETIDPSYISTNNYFYYSTHEDFFSDIICEEKDFLELDKNRFFIEPKVGIGIDNSARSSSKTGQLYRVGMSRAIEELHFIIGFNAPDGFELPNNGFLRIGGEGKIASFKQFEKPQSIDISSLSQSISNQFKLVLSTPAIFDEGWKAGWMDQGQYKLNSGKQIEFKFLGAITGKAVAYGGFNMKPPGPKPMKKAVGAGSVYYFELTNNHTLQTCYSDLVEAFHGQSICSERFKKEGWGITYLGAVK